MITTTRLPNIKGAGKVRMVRSPKGRNPRSQVECAPDTGFGYDIDVHAISKKPAAAPLTCQTVEGGRIDRGLGHQEQYSNNGHWAIARGYPYSPNAAHKHLEDMSLQRKLSSVFRQHGKGHFPQRKPYRCQVKV